MRYIGNFQRVSCHILATFTAPTRCSANQSTHPILQRKRRAIEFRLREKSSGTPCCGVDIVTQLFIRRGFVEAPHRKQMVHLHAAWRYISAHAPELGMVGVKRLQFVPKTIEFSIRNFGLSEVVVEVRMMCDLLGQPRNPLSGVLRFWGFAAHGLPPVLHHIKHRIVAVQSNLSATNSLFSSGHLDMMACGIRRR